jgi:4-hydroxyacetophenone monooxygenase
MSTGARRALSAALAEADLVILASVVAHVTGDPEILDRFGDVDFDRGRGPGHVPGDVAEAIRAEAHDVLARLDGAELGPTLRADALLRIMRFCAGEDVPAEYVPLVVEEANFDGTDPRQFAWTQPPPTDTLSAYRVGIIGAGLAGLCAAIRLGQAGIPYTVIEKNPKVGGTWFENTYPDLRVDVPNHFYSYSFAPNPDWSHYYARGREIADYVERCADTYGVLANIRFGTEVCRATFDDASARWSVELRCPDGREETLQVDALISAVGMLNRPSLPDIAGLDSFQGSAFHSSRWDHDVDLAGARVAVVGTGASAMQFVPAIAPEAGRLTIFQRSRHWVTRNPNYQRSVTDGEKWCFRHLPHYGGWYRFLLFWNNADRLYPAFRVDPTWPSPDVAVSRPNDKLRQLMTAYAVAQLAQRPEMIDQVLPDYPAFGKRMLLDNGWYRTLLRNNVRLLNDRIARVTPRAVVAASGEEVEADALILATGFLPNKYLWPMEIISRGRRLQDVWGEDPRAYLGISVPSFPNLFVLYGPNTNPVVGSVIFMLECQVNYVVRCIAAMIEGHYATMDCRQDVHDRYNERVDAEHEQLVWRHPKVHSYYNNSRGRVTTNAPWRLVDYWRMTTRPDMGEYVLTRADHRGGVGP